MNPLRILFIVSELAPFTGDSARARELRFLSRSMAEIGAEVCIALPGPAVPKKARGGLARRLSPHELSTSDDAAGKSRELDLYEGSIGDNRVSVLVFDGLDAPDGDGDGAQRLLARATLSLLSDRDSLPDLVVATHGSEVAVAELHELASAEHGAAPAVLYLVRDVQGSALSQGLARADRVVVPSRMYADALVAEMESGRMGLASRELAEVREILYGVPAGTDTLEWNPHQDGALHRDFPRDPLVGKAAHKRGLRDSLGLRPHRDDIPLVAIIGPIDESILTYGTVNSLAQARIQMVVVADRKTDAKSLRHLTRLANQNPQQVATRVFEDRAERLAFEHQLLAGADFSLVPHDFSPAPLCDLHCLHYGTLPIAPRTGWYADYLVEVDSLSATGSGFFYEPYDGDYLRNALDRALHAFGRKESFGELVRQVMTIDLSWRTAAQRYINIIVAMMDERRGQVRDAV